MRARALFAGLVTISTVVIAGPASAKASIAGANITGPGLGGGLRIEAPGHGGGLWESGIDVAGGLDDARPNSVEELGLTRGDLGPRYLVSYRFEGWDDPIRQDLYPYAKSGPVTYTPPGQELTVGIRMQIVSGWYRSSPGFLRYLNDQGLPETNPAASTATGEPAPDPAPRTAPWALIVMALVTLAALSLAAPAVRRRVLARSRVNR